MEDNYWILAIDIMIEKTREYLIALIHNAYSADNWDDIDKYEVELGQFESRFGDTTNDDTNHDTYLRLRQEAFIRNGN